jgi:hypothetical protein
MPPKLMPSTQAVRHSHRVQQGQGITGTLRHAVGAFGGAAPPDPSLVGGEEVELGGEHRQKQPRVLERHAGSVREEEPRAGPGAFIEEVDIVDAGEGHGDLGGR